MPNFPLFQYQSHTEPVVASAESITEDKWHFPWRDPVRFRRISAALMSASGLYETLGAPPEEAVTEDRWHQPWSEPIVKRKVGLRAASQQVLAFQHPFVTFSWYEPLTDPVRIKRGQRSSLQQFYTADTTVIPVTKLIGWFGNLSDPVRINPGLKTALQQFLAYSPRLLPNPTITGILDALETKDTFLGGFRVWNRVVSGEVGVIRKNFSGGEVGIVQHALSSGASGVISPVAVPATASAVTPITTAHVSIRII